MSFAIRYISLIFSFILAGSNLFAQVTDDEFASKKTATKLVEVIAMDSIKADELLKRATIWLKAESTKYKKINIAASLGKAECSVAFLIKPKELNPMVDYTGKISMKVVIDCKNDKYRYVVSDIQHVSKNGVCTGGSVDNLVAECGSYKLEDLTWKKIKGEALRDAAVVAADIKEAMQKLSEDSAKDNW